MAYQGALAVILAAALAVMVNGGPFDWMTEDSFDQLDRMMNAVTAENCETKPASALKLPTSVVTHQPRANDLLSQKFFANRTSMIHLHNMALSRSFYLSYMNYKANESWNFGQQPGFLYYYMSLAADVGANPGWINGSSVYFEYNLTFPNFYSNLPLNHTLLLFGPHAYRLDDYKDPMNWLREPTNNTINVVDIGAGSESNYTSTQYKTNDWYSLFLPDFSKSGDSLKKFTYSYAIKYSNETGKFVSNEFQEKTFFGPPNPSALETQYLPVLYTAPYFDCGKTNKWIISAVSPVVDHLSRYHDFDHIRRPRYSAVVTMDMDFLRIDFNPCPIGQGNPIPNFLAGTARCKPTTMCQPLSGFGFQRGGYECVCRPGYRLPHWQNGAFQGVDIELATTEEYKNGFDCLPVGYRMVVPQIQNKEGGPSGGVIVEKFTTTTTTTTTTTPRPVTTTAAPVTPSNNTSSGRRKRSIAAHAPKDVLDAIELNKMREELRKKRRVASKIRQEDVEIIKRNKRKINKEKERQEVKRRRKREAVVQAFNEESSIRVNLLIEKMDSVTSANCRSKTQEELELPGDMAYGTKEQFESQGRVAVRLAQFLSNFMQNVDEKEDFGNLLGDNKLHVEQMFGEVGSNVMGNVEISGCGVFFDHNKFLERNGTMRSYFGPYAWKSLGDQYLAVDFAGDPEGYADEVWFSDVRDRWRANTYGLTRFTMNPWMRADIAGTALRKFDQYPLFYYAASYELGEWFGPYFDCDGYVDDWLMTYSVPFFGLNSLKRIEFKGVVIVDVKLRDLDINQCPQEFYVPNAFKGTARCDYESTYCKFEPSQKFEKGGYKCECKQGYEYPFIDQGWYFDGKEMEEEYRKLKLGIFSRYDTLKCRIAGAPKIASSGVIMTVLALMYMLLKE
ncbi:uncharacterized protein LOC106151208 [Lingula anatina]|uniref:Uncharacterized protein LOC106151208 n=1 Tax=Lingula anatina TaxID=7574 RepID=A0A1S3H197_LINAN|nr:uncharacterized protein LOC106151208 [Lingula anatina]|eukprot:XP_013379783.1 uncharacterized protein LOC106151208 [Lingula anatina]